MLDAQDAFWWLLILLGVLIAAFAALHGLRLARRARRERQVAEKRNDVRQDPET